jgi:hypothetical protein
MMMRSKDFYLFYSELVTLTATPFLLNVGNIVRLALSQPFLHMCSLAWSSLALKFFLVLSSLQLVSAWCFITCNGDGTCEFLVAGGWRSRSEEGIDTRERWWWWSSWCRGVDFKLVWVCDQWVSEFVWRCDNLSSILFGDGFVEADLLLLWCS